MSSPAEPLLRVRGLCKRFRRGGGRLGGSARWVVALDGLDLDLEAGRISALVGASGAGKSVAALCIARLLEPDGGSVRFAGQELTGLPEAALRPLRPSFQLVFQDSWGGLSPHRSVRDLLLEPLSVHGLARGAEAEARLAQVLDELGLPRSVLSALPGALSGGQRQRVALARALVLEPRLLICDEPTSALDLSLQAGILTLLLRLRAERGLACLFVSHEIALVRHLADRVAVLDAGRIVEEGPTAAVYAAPQHPATRALLAASLGQAPPAGSGSAGQGLASRAE